MKRGKDDEKIMGPMFPRLHVNDTGKGGPRAPPRNKMALYEQVSIPSQRFSSGMLPLNPSNTSSLVPPGSSSQGSSIERRNMNFPSHLSPSTSTSLADKFNTRQLGAASVSAPLVHLDQRKKVRDEDDFMVPVFVNSESGQQGNKTKHVSDGEKLTPSNPTYPGRSIILQNPRDQDPNIRSITSDANLRNEIRHQNEESPRVLPHREHSVKTYADLSAREKIDGLAEEANVSPNHDCGDHPASRLNRMHENDPFSLQDLRTGRQPAENGCIDGPELMGDIAEGIPLQRSISYSEGNHSVRDEGNNDKECHGDKTHGSLQWANGDNSDVSETSMVDSISGVDISPDDVVGTIGQTRFWKARRAIVNQQRVFAVQVFELHRLIKVQRLIAGSPHILLEDTAYLGKPSFKSSPAKRLPLEFIVKPLPHATLKDDSEKPSHKMECSAENAVGRTFISSVKNGSQPSNYGPFPGNQPPTPVHGDNKTNPWCFPQMPGHQWLVPVMSPSEGLIYKPYPGPGFMGSVCGGCGPFGQTPMTGNFMNSAYGVPSLPRQGFGVLPGAHSYFPPYGMPVMNPSVSSSAVEQMNQFAAPGLNAHNGQLSGGGANFNMQHQSSCNLPSEKNGAISHVMKFKESKDTELQGSSASSPGERVHRERSSAATSAEGKDALPLFPTAPTVPEAGSQSLDTDHRTRVIKVVPHNPRSATESAARIFQSIQEERKQYDSI